MISDTVKFWSFLLILISSFVCLLFVLHHFLSNRKLRNAVNNHVIIVLLFICLIAEVTFYPWMLYYFQNKDTWTRSLMFCVTWGFLDWLLYVGHTMLFAWATIERHILIFHDKWISTKTRRFFFHYLPLILIPLYLSIFYSVMYFFPNCKNRLQPSSLLCIFPCLYDIYIFSMWDFIVDQLVPIFTIIVFSTSLFVRVLRQKHRMCGMINWRKHRKMAIELLSISIFYVLILLPYAIVYIVRIFGLINSLTNELSAYTVFFSYFILLLFPFICALSLPELQTKMKNFFQLRRQAKQMDPITLNVRTPVTNPIHTLGK